MGIAPYLNPNGSLRTQRLLVPPMSTRSKYEISCSHESNVDPHDYLLKLQDDYPGALEDLLERGQRLDIAAFVE